MSDTRTDQELVVAALKDRHAFIEIVERYQAALSRYIARLGITDADTVKDLLQESFIKAYINLNDYNRSFSLSGWLYRIVHNEVIDHFRKQKHRPHSVEREDDLVLFDKIVDEFDIEKELDGRKRQYVMREALDTLEQHYRDVIVLRYFEEKSYDEISDILRIPSGTVATYLSRAKSKLKAVLMRLYDQRIL
ncbi:MAG: subfamily polymerase sigma factor [Candidatus Kaiserbacteria bacterium]|nr:subfamily polymerase sigma factor [Candidatus Kaiserbacteria bacterium]